MEELENKIIELLKQYESKNIELDWQRNLVKEGKFIIKDDLHYTIKFIIHNGSIY